MHWCSPIYLDFTYSNPIFCNEFIYSIKYIKIEKSKYIINQIEDKNNSGKANQIAYGKMKETGFSLIELILGLLIISGIFVYKKKY